MTRTAVLAALVLFVLFALAGGLSVDARLGSKGYRSRKLVSSDDVDSGQTDSASGDVLPGRFLVKLRPRPGSVSTRSSSPVVNRAAAIVKRMRKKRVSVYLTQQYKRAFEGFSLQTDNIDIALACLDAEYEVMSVYPVVLVPPPDAASVPRISPVTLSGDYAANSSATGNIATTLASLGLAQTFGTNIRVGLIDTGVDHTHPALQGPTGSRVAFRYAFVSDNYQPGAAPEQNDNTMDCMGHGTHVAGIIAGNYSFPGFRYFGVAPGATLGSYKVFGCSGSTTSDVILAALDRAARDNMQVINLSVGIPGAWGGPVAEAIERLAQSGTLVVASVGNEGGSGLFLPSSIANAPSVIAVGSTESAAAPPQLQIVIDNPTGPDILLTSRASYGNVSQLVGASLQIFNPSNIDGCDAERLGDLTSRVAVLTAAGGCAAAAKASNAADVGAVGIVLVGDDNALGDLLRLPSSWPAPNFSVPLLAVTATDRTAALWRLATTQANRQLPLRPPPPPPPSSLPPPSPPPFPPPPSPSPTPPRPLPPSPPPSPPPTPLPSPPPSPSPSPSMSRSSPPPPLSFAPPNVALGGNQVNLNQASGSQWGGNLGGAFQGSMKSRTSEASAEPSWVAPLSPGAPPPPPSPSPPMSRSPPPSPPSFAPPNVAFGGNQGNGNQGSGNQWSGNQGNSGSVKSRNIETPSPPGPPPPPPPPPPPVTHALSSPHGALGGRRSLLLSAVAHRRQLQQPQNPQSGQQQPQAFIKSISGSVVSATSSWGPSPDLRLKPTVAAPGGAVLGLAPGTVPGNPTAGFFAYRSGTSQAAPYVSGALALMLESGRFRNVTQLVRALSLTAAPVFDVGADPASAPAASPLRVGGGAVSIAALASTRIDVSPARIELGSNLTFGSNFTVWLDVSMPGSLPSGMTFALGHFPSASINSTSLMVINRTASGPFNNRTALPFDPVFSPVAASVVFGSLRQTNISSMTVPMNGNMRLRVTFSLPSQPGGTRAPGVFFSGYIVLRPINNPDPSAPPQPMLTVPYLGYSNPLSGLPVLVGAGMSSSTGSWFWDDRQWAEDGKLTTEVLAPPPPPSPNPPPREGVSVASIDYDYMHGSASPPFELAVPPAPPPPPRVSAVNASLTYRLAAGARMPSLALFMQRQPVAREVQLWRASLWSGAEGVRMGTVRILGGVLPRVSNESPLIINWDGTYVDAVSGKDTIVTPGSYYFVVRLTRGSAWGDAPESTATVDVWQSPRFTFTSSKR